MNVLTMNEIKSFKEEHARELLNIPGVTGCGIGIKKYIEDHVTCPCIQIYVESWTPEVRSIYETGTFLNVPIKVITTGHIELL